MNVERKNAKDDLRLYMPEVIGMLKREGKFPAMHVYACTLRSYEKFCAEERYPKNTTASLSMQEIFTPERLKEYEDWLAGQQSSPNTISTYMRTLQAVYNRWMSPGIEGYNPVLFKDVYTKVESRTKRALTAEQMEQLRNTDFSVLTLRQQQVLTYFLLMFMLRGMPFIDLAHLRKSDLRNRRITYRRHKTGKLMVVDVPPDAMRLLQKYRDKTDSEYLFPLLHGGLFMEEHHHRYQETLRHFNRELARLMKQLLPGVSVSSYTARHTWATLAYHSGVPVGLISQSLGHSSIRVTMTYLKPFDAEKTHEKALVDFFVKVEMNRAIEQLQKEYSMVVMDNLKSDLNVMLNAPANFTYYKDTTDFFWSSNNANTGRMDLIVYTFPYTDPNTFTEEYLVAKRDSVLKANLPGSFPGSYMQTETRAGVEYTPITLNSKYCGVMRGLWRMQGDMMGGPFVSHTRLDEKNHRVVVAEGFVYAPETDKRNFMRRIEAALFTLRLPGEFDEPVTETLDIPKEKK